MASRVFILGSTGYVGGELLVAIFNEQLPVEVVCLVREEEQGRRIQRRWSSVEVVIGDLDSDEVLQREAAKADVVIQAAHSDHNASVRSLIGGLSTGSRRGFLLHVSGAASVIDAPNGHGQPSARVWDDVVDIAEISSFDDDHIHAVTEREVISEGIRHGVRTAILSPPTIYGVGHGTGNTKSMQVPWLIQAFLKRGKAFTIGQGQNAWSSVHVSDLASAIVLLIREGLSAAGSKAKWGPEGVYFIRSDEYVFSELVARIAGQLFRSKAIDTREVDQLSNSEAEEINKLALIIWGTDVQLRSSRIEQLGWKPKANTIYDTLPEAIALELDA